MAESTVYGARVGDFVSGWIKTASHDSPRPEQIADAEKAANQFLERKQGESPWTLREELGRVTWEKVGIVRHGDKLKSALSDIGCLQKRAEQVATPGGRAFNLTWQQALDMRSMLIASELIARSALLRQESRGAHYREDFQQLDNENWLKNIYLARDGAGVKSWTEPVKMTKLQP